MKKILFWIVVLLLSVSMITVFSLAGCKEEVAEEEEAVAEEEVVVEEEAVAEEEVVEGAAAILADAGYIDTDGDGFVEAPDGSTIELSLIVPSGWTDWMESIKVVSRSCQDAGINVVCDYPDYGAYLDQKLNGTFEMMICNDAQMSNTPWTYYDWMFQNPVANIATIQNGNYGRYDNQEAFDLVDQLDMIPPEDVAGMKAVIGQLNEIFMRDLPMIPLWYNGAWTTFNDMVWTNWPTSAEDTPNYVPVTWRGYWNMASILMLTELELKEGVEAGTGTYPRNETLYTSGTQWGPPGSWNPFNTGGYATGTLGLCYETLFLYDPIADEYIPWLAKSGEWSGNVYELKVQEGINWSDGTPFTAADVKFTFELAETAPIGISPIWNFLDSIDQVDDYTLNFNFSEALYQQWSNYLYSTPIVPEHIWSIMSVEDVTSGINENPVGTGAYLYEASGADRMVWVKNDNWWAIDALGLEVAPKYIVDLSNSGNNVILGLMMRGDLDLSNNFLPNIATLKESGWYDFLSTYYAEAPYNLSANTAWLLLNLEIKPMDDVAFRKAVAAAIEVDQIVEVVFTDLVASAHPSGLLPPWTQYVE